MKKIFTILFIIPIIVLSQNFDGFFEISKDEFYHNKMAEWKNKAYEDFDSKFEILTDNDSIFAFKARGYFFSETYQLNINKDDKIKKIEIFFHVHKGSLEDWFPYKYPIDIADVFKNLGSPIVTKENLKYESRFNDGSEFNFKKYYKWNKVSYLDLNTSMEIGELKRKKPIKNRRGKIKSYQYLDYGYMSYSVIGNGKPTTRQKNFYVATEIAKGINKSWKENQRELLNILGRERFDTSEGWLDKSILPSIIFMDKTNDPKLFFKTFFSLANLLYDIEFNEQFSEKNQKYTYTTLPNGLLAKANGMDKDCCIEIFIDLKNWNNSNFFDKMFIMFHEFGHDIFNLKHSDGIRLMATNKIEFDDLKIFGEMLNEMMLTILKKQRNK